MTGDLLSKIIKLPEALRDMFYLIHHHIAVDIIIHLCTQDTSTGFIRVSDTYLAGGLVYNQLSFHTDV
jgi:hypothetical protein